jgi:hypothetical protein
MFREVAKEERCRCLTYEEALEVAQRAEQAGIGLTWHSEDWRRAEDKRDAAAAFPHAPVHREKPLLGLMLDYLDNDVAAERTGPIAPKEVAEGQLAHVLQQVAIDPSRQAMMTRFQPAVGPMPLPQRDRPVAAAADVHLDPPDGAPFQGPVEADDDSSSDHDSSSDDDGPAPKVKVSQTPLPKLG